jgi:hypothetical protein
MSEVTRGMQFVQKVRPVYVDTDGNEVEYPSLALPYHFTECSELYDTGLADGAAYNFNFTQANWGVGNRYWVSHFMFVIDNTNDFNTKRDDAFTLLAYRAGQYLWSEDFRDSPVNRGGAWRLRKTIVIPLNVITAGQTLTLEFHNASGRQQDYIYCYVYGYSV